MEVRIVFRQIKQVQADLTNDRHLGSVAQEPSKSRAIMQIIISLIVLLGAGYVLVVGGYPEGVEKFCTGAIGTILGFWLS